jgi:hypothetical protein
MGRRGSGLGPRRCAQAADSPYVEPANAGGGGPPTQLRPKLSIGVSPGRRGASGRIAAERSPARSMAHKCFVADRPVRSRARRCRVQSYGQLLAGRAYRRRQGPRCGRTPTDLHRHGITEPPPKRSSAAWLVDPRLARRPALGTHRRSPGVKEGPAGSPSLDSGRSACQSGGKMVDLSR